MTTYEINNQVRITHTPCRYFGYVGTIVDSGSGTGNS